MRHAEGHHGRVRIVRVAWTPSAQYGVASPGVGEPFMKNPAEAGFFIKRIGPDQARNGISNRATMLMILISGLMAGPAVSL